MRYHSEVDVAISLVTWAMVSVGDPLAELVLENVDEEADQYLVEHMDDLEGRAMRSPPTNFVGNVDRARFDLLLRGSDEEFLATAQDLAGRLLGEMRDSRQAGLFVAARSTATNGQQRAAVVKLQVVAPHTGYLRRTRGRVRLRAVKAALNMPGELQKGALYPDPRSSSAVVVGDQLDVGALYFLRAVGVRQDQSPKAAVAALYSAVKVRVPHAEETVAASISGRRPESVSKALDGLVEDLPELAPMRPEIEAELRGQRRPPVALDPDRASSLKRMISGNGIEIAGPVAAMRARVEDPSQLDDGRWQVVVTFDSKPSDRIR